MRNITRFLGAVLIFGGLATAADAAVVLSDNFDGYANQAALEANWPGITAPGAVLLDGTLQVSAPNSVSVPATGTATSRRSRRSFAETSTVDSITTPGVSIVWSFDFYDSITGNPQRNYSNLQDSIAPGATNQLISIGLNNNQTSAQSGGNYYMARILGYTTPLVDPDGGPNESVTGAGIYAKLNDFGTSPLRSVGWHNLRVEISSNDGLSTDYAFYVDNVLAELVSNVGNAASIRSYDNIALGGGVSNGTAKGNFDNVSLVVVPEPASLTLLGTVGLGVLAWRRRAA